MLALAGIFQAAALVKLLANTGQCPPQAFETSIQSIYTTDPNDVAEVYQGTGALSFGLEHLVQGLSHGQRCAEITRYVLLLLALERKLTSNKQLKQRLRERMVKAKQQLAFFPATHPNSLANLADIYLNTLGTFNLRIQVLGKQMLLTDAHIMDKIRALLLAGIRSAVLWQQLGGSRWTLLLQHRKMVAMANEVLASNKGC